MSEELELINQLEMIKRVVEGGNTELASAILQGLIDVTDEKVNDFEREHADA